MNNEKIVHVLINQNCNSRKEALALLTNIASKIGVIDPEHKKKLYNAFIEREKISTTGLEDGFSIPHALIAEIKKPMIIALQFNKYIDWPTMDNTGVKIAFGILVPKNSSRMHIKILSSIATLLIDKDFRIKLKSSSDSKSFEKLIDLALKEKLEAEEENFEVLKGSINIVGISACASGVAHTYMAKEALEKYGKENNYNIRIETQGQRGQEFNLTEQEIEKADAVIIAADVYVELDRFENKKMIKVKTNDAIGNAKMVVEESLKSQIYKTSNIDKNISVNSTKFKSSKVKNFMGHLLSGVGRMIPFIVFSGIINSILVAIGGIELENGNLINSTLAHELFLKAAGIGFTVFIAMMGGFISESIAGRSAFGTGFIATFVAASPDFTFWYNIPQIDEFFPPSTDPNAVELKNVGLSLFAAIMMGFAAGYVIKWVNSWKVKRMLIPLVSIIFIPAVVTSLLVFPYIFAISGALGYLMNGLVFGISEAARIQGLNFLIGFIIGAMVGFDMGGPVNKIAMTTATALIVVDPRLMGAASATTPVASIGCGFATLFGYKMFDDKEKAEGITAIGLGFFGISEGAIPFAVKRPKQVVIANMLGSAIAGGLAFLFFVGGFVGMWGGPIVAITGGIRAPIDPQYVDFIGKIPNVFGGLESGSNQFVSVAWFIFTILIGSVIQAFTFLFLMKVSTKEGKENAKKSFDNQWLKIKSMFKLQDKSGLEK